MALDPSTTDPCSLLNASSYYQLWIKINDDDMNVYGKIANQGILTTYLTILNYSNTPTSAPVLANNQPSSTFRLVKFMSGGIPVEGKNYNKMSDLALNSGNTYESIVDTYIVGSKGLGMTDYTTTRLNSPMPESSFWTSSDESATVKTSLLGKLIKQGYLLSSSELFTPSQLSDGSSNPTVGSESLIYLYKQDQSKNGLTSAQTTRKSMLEAKNLRFFGAFLCEYCFYRTRYEWLLKQFFIIYNTPSVGPKAFDFAQYSPIINLFAGQGTGDNKYAGSQPTQAEALKVIIYHMACLNTRMSDMRKLLGVINIYYNGVFTSIQSALNDNTIVGSNSELTNTIQSLQASANDANGYVSQTEFTKSVMEYNSEKNRYSNIMLGLYAFLNIAALATVFQLARSP